MHFKVLDKVSYIVQDFSFILLELYYLLLFEAVCLHLQKF